MKVHTVEHTISSGGAVDNRAISTAFIAVGSITALLGGTITASTAIGAAPVSGPIAALGGAIAGMGATNLFKFIE